MEAPLEKIFLNPESPEQEEFRIPEQYAPQVERIDRQLDLAKATERLENEKLNLDDLELLANSLEGRGWQKVLEKPQPGDQILSFLSPGGPFSVKVLNGVFGEKAADKIIHDTVNKALRKQIDNAGLGQELQFSFKEKRFLIPPKSNLSPEQLQHITQEASQEIDQGIKALTQAELNRIFEETKQIKAEYSTQAAKEGRNKKELQEKYTRKLTIKEEEFLRVRNYRKSISASSYQLNSEMVTVEAPISEEEGSANIHRALAQSLQGASLSRSFEDLATAEGYESQNLLRASQESYEIANNFFEEGLTITDKDGHEYPVFHKDEEGFLQIDDRLLQKIRKAEFAPQPDNPEEEAKYQDLLRWKDLTNVVDFFGPYTKEEISGKKPLANGESLQEKVTRKTKVIEIFKDTQVKLQIPENERVDGKSDTDIWNEFYQTLNTGENSNREKILQELRTEEKDPLQDSASEFYRKTLEMKNGYDFFYLDVVGLGVEQTQYFSRLHQEAVQLSEAGNEEALQTHLDKMTLSAGDPTSEKMRTFRRVVKEVIREKLIEKGKTEEDFTQLATGGDEFLLAVDKGSLDQGEILAIQKEVREKIKEVDGEDVVARMVRATNFTFGKNSGGENQIEKSSREKTVELIQTMEGAENGSEYCKIVEKLVAREKPPFHELDFKPPELKNALAANDYFIEKNEDNNNILYFGDHAPPENQPLSQVIQQFELAKAA